MTRGVRRFVKIYDARADEGFEITFERSATHRNRGEMAGADKEAAVIFEKQWPITGVDSWG